MTIRGVLAPHLLLELLCFSEAFKQALHQSCAAEKTCRISLAKGPQAEIRVVAVGQIERDRCGRGPGRPRSCKRRRKAGAIGIALGGLLGCRAPQNCVERAWQVGSARAQRRQCGAQLLLNQLGRRAPSEWPHAGQRLVEHQAQAIYIGLRTNGLSAQLLGREIGWRTGDDAWCGEWHCLVKILGDPKVGQVVVAALFKQNVGRLEVAVHDLALMRVRQGAADLQKQSLGCLAVERAALELRMQGAADEQAHDQVGTAGLTPEVVQRHNVGVLKTRNRLAFGLKAADEIGTVGELRLDHLDCHCAANRWLFRAKHRTEPAQSDLLADDIVADPRARQRCEVVAHWPRRDGCWRRGRIGERRARAAHKLGHLVGWHIQKACQSLGQRARGPALVGLELFDCRQRTADAARQLILGQVERAPTPAQQAPE